MKRRSAMVGVLLALVGLGVAGATAAAAAPPGQRGGGPCSAGYVGLTFDDGPTASTPSLLSILRSNNNSTATFFDVGAQMQRYPSAVRDEARLGTVANHTYDHPFLDELSYTEIFNELLGTNQIAQQITRTAPTLFRPPFDRIDADVTAAQYSLNLLTVLWNIDSDDYDGISSSAIAQNVWNAQAGDVILFHDGVTNTLLALPAILRHFQSEKLCAGDIIPSATPHFAWPTDVFGDVVFYAQVVAPGTRAPSVASLHLTPQQMSTGVVATALARE